MSSAWVSFVAVGTTALLGVIAGGIQRCFYPAVKGQPPGWVFSVVWTILYFCLAFAGIRILAVKNNKGTGRSVGRHLAFFALLALLALWPFVQWYWCSTGVALLIIIMALILTIILIVIMIPKDKWASILLVPLALWLGYATLLNWRLAQKYE